VTAPSCSDALRVHNACYNAQCTTEVILRELCSLTLVGKALSHPIRERMLWMLEAGERCGCKFAPDLGIDPSVVSRYLGTLERAGLVTSRREGVRVMWKLSDPALLDALRHLAELTREKVA